MTTMHNIREHIVFTEGCHADASGRSLARQGSCPTFTLRLPCPAPLSDGSRYVAFVGCRVNDPQNTLDRIAGCFPRHRVRL